jgi:hypothetical protein
MDAATPDLPSLRDLVLKHLEDEFGPPRVAANVFTWAIDVGLGGGYAAVNVSVNCYLTPDDVNVWIFDPHVVKRGDGARYLKVPQKDQVRDIVAQVKNHLFRTRQRIRRRENNQRPDQPPLDDHPSVPPGQE